ncbi:hypothetical protein [Croceiramulus getboli]|nr:hypothetical protein P8624_11655 [Flavobacteriaceae bacterium YJPT1-3]
MQITKTSVTFILIIMTLCTSCSKEEVLNLSTYSTTKFEKNFPVESSLARYDHLQEYSSESIGKSSPDFKGVTFPIVQDNQVIGRYIGLESELSAIYIDFSDYTNKILVINVLEPETHIYLDMILDPVSGNYVPVLPTEKGFWCSAACAIGAIAIASSDGPAPIMDALAISYSIACLADCASE